MRKYFIGFWGFILYLLGMIFVISSLDLFKTHYWGFVFFISGLIFYSGDFINLFIFIKQFKIDKKNIIIYLILNLFLLVIYLLYWFIETPMAKQENIEWILNIKNFLLFIFILIFVTTLFYRIILGYELSNRIIEKSFIRIDTKKMILQFISFLLILVLMNLFFARYNIFFDLSPGYYSLSKEAQRIISEIKNQNIRIFVFLPDQQLVRTKKDTTVSKLYEFSEELKIMFGELNKINPSIYVEFYNADLLDINDQSFGNVANGTIIIRNYKADLINQPYLERRVYIFTENDLEKLEENLVQSILQVASEPIKVYFSTQNGERYTSFQNKPFDIDFFIQILKLYNFDIKEWNLEAGYPFRIPEDIQILVLAGPSFPLSNDARKSILDYLINKKGKLLIFIDSRSSEDFQWLFEELKSPYRFKKATLIQVENRPNFIYTDQIISVDLTKNIRNRENVKFLLYGGGFFSKERETTTDFNTKEFLYSPYTTWEEKNMNFRKDKEETNLRFTMGLELSKDESKILIFSDVEWITNRFLIQNLYNQNLNLATDALFYLANKMNISGIPEEKRENQAILIDSERKLKIILIGIIGIPSFMIITISLLIYLYKKKYNLLPEKI